MAANIPSFKLNNGVLMPSVGMGCWMGSPGSGGKVYGMCLNAIKAGYRHFDTADGYQNEEDVGKALRDSGLPREEFFVTTKLNNKDHHQVAAAFQKSLETLGTEYIDLYLMHWPQAIRDGQTLQPDESPTIHETWAEMVKLLDTGKVRALGVSNFGVPLLKKLLGDDTTTTTSSSVVVPAVNQVELHPLLPQTALQEFCSARGIVLTAYSPIGQPQAGTVSPVLSDETIVKIAKKHGVGEGQVVLSWAVQHGIVVVPKSENPERMKKNITARGKQLVQLDDDDLKAIDGIHKENGKHRSLLHYHSESGTVFGWTYEQMGW
ncbi:aldo/keto reductase, partial [Cryphonectria parasitica EP155]